MNEYQDSNGGTGDFTVSEMSSQSAMLNMSNNNLLQMAQKAEKLVEAINTIMKAAIKVTTHKDWVKIGDSPYLQETGASKIARLFNMSWQINSPSKIYDDDGSGHYQYRTSGKFYFAGSETNAEGLRSTRDRFFIGSSEPKKPQDVDERSVMQAAYTNCLNNGIKRTLPGLRNITAEYLQECGIDTSKIEGYGFNSKTPAEMSGEAQDQKTEIERMLRDVYGEKWTEGLKAITTFTGRDGNEVQGKTDINKLSERMVSVTYGKVKGMYDKWRAENGQQTNNGAAVSSGAGEDQGLPMQ